MAVYAVARSDGGPPRLGLAVGRKAGNSVERSTVKRRLRAVFRKKASGIGPVDVVTVARAGVVRMTYKDLENTFLRLISESLKRAGSRASVSAESEQK
jgi:ribonuclease P protein component